MKDSGAKMKDNNIKIQKVNNNKALVGPYSVIAKMQL